MEKFWAAIGRPAASATGKNRRKACSSNEYAPPRRTRHALRDAQQMAGATGLLSLKQLWRDLAPLRETALCGPACQVAWGGPSVMAVLTRFRRLLAAPSYLGLSSCSLRTKFNSAISVSRNPAVE